jgi:hypothetical protein
MAFARGAGAIAAGLESMPAPVQPARMAGIAAKRTLLVAKNALVLTVAVLPVRS